MANKVFSLNDYSIKSGDIFFFDNNIWMYLLCPIAQYNEKRQKAYSKFLNYILERKNHIYINSLVLSEFSNRYLKLDYDITKRDPNKAGVFNDYKKDFVGSTEYENTVATLKIQIKNILKMCIRCSDEFNSINTDEILNVFTYIGFNDSYYIHFAQRKNLIIVTDDSDFLKNQIPNLGLTILTFKPN